MPHKDPEVRRAYIKSWRANMTDEQRKKYAETQRRIVARNRDKVRANSRKSWEKHKDRYNAYNRSDAVRARRRHRYAERVKNDVEYRTKLILRNRFKSSFRYQKATPAQHYSEMLGCRWIDFRKHIEALWLDGMSWDNYGSWEIDHVMPCALFDLTKPEQQKLCFHYTNLQPLWAIDNKRKGKKYMKISNTSNIHLKPPYICIYGCSGIGKTSTVKSLPHPETLLLDAESGLASLEGTSIDTISLSRDDDGNFIPEEKRYERLLEFNAFIQKEQSRKKYKYIVIDSLTEVGQNIQKLMASKHVGFLAWSEYTKAMIDLLKFYRDLGHYTIIFTALEGRIEDNDGASFAYPDIGGKKAKEYLLPQFDEVFRMIADSDKNRMFVTRTTSKTQAKDRSNKLNELEPANLGEVLKKMRGE